MLRPLSMTQFWTNVCATGIRMQRRTDNPNPISAHEDAVDSSFLLTPITRHANRLTSRIGNCAANMESNVTSWAVSFIGFICD